MAEQLAKVGDVIQQGELVPDNVVGVLDCQDDDLVLNALGHWHSPSAADVETCRRDVPCGIEPITDYAPLTVTAVREQPAEPVAVIARFNGQEQLIEGVLGEPESDVVHYHIPGDASAATLCGEDVWDESTSVTERAGSSNCTACRKAADEDTTPTFHVDEIFPTEKPQQADASVLLDLVWQLRNMVDQDTAADDAHALLDRIEALAPQHPVQARSITGRPLWHHACGGVRAGDAWADGRAHGCTTPLGPWRPLLVGGDPAPERKLVGPPRAHLDAPCTDACYETAPEGGEIERLRRLLKTQAENFSAAVDKLIAGRDDARANLTRALQARGEFLDETIRLRAEIERLKSDNDRLTRVQKRTEAEDLQVIAERDDYYEWADRLAETIAEFLHIDIGEHSNMNLPWQAALIALTDAVSPPQQDGPIVLTLPSDAVALIGQRNYRVRYARKGPDLWISDDNDGAYSYKLVQILEREGSVTVEMAPPRVPRTWPKLTEEHADLPSVVSVERHGTWRRLALPDDRLYEQSDGFGAIRVSLRLPLSGLQLLGDVFEVLDEPGGQQ